MNTETLDLTKTNSPAFAVKALPEVAIAPSYPAIRIKSILVPLDFSETSFKSLQYAAPFARQFGAKITLLNIVEPSVYTVDFSYIAPLGPEHFTGIEDQLKAIRARMIPDDVQVDTIVRQCFVFDGILDVAREIEADLIITSTHGRTGLKHLFLGSTAENTVRRAPCPVLVVRELEHDFV